MSKSIALIIGSGKRIGASTTQMLHAKGYRVAQAARSVDPKDTNEDTLLLKTDLTHTGAVNEIFEALRTKWGEPSVVIYNAAAAHFTAPEDPFATSVEDFSKDLAINTTSAYAAAKEAVNGFSTLPESAVKTFIYTGNGLNQKLLLGGLTLGVGKTATAHIIASAATTFAEKGFRFYYVDERKVDGSFALNDLSGPGHADFFASLIEGDAAVPWLATFVANEGYSAFKST